MESSAFPIKIKIELIKSKVMNMFYVPYNYAKVQHATCLITGNISQIPFTIFIVAQREMHQSKNAHRKNLAQAIY